MLKQSLLLLKDVDDLGRAGQVVSVKCGYARNYLLPQQFAIIADKHTLLRQKKLQEERAKQAKVDAEEAKEQAKIIETLTLSIPVKVDPEGRMYGSVSALDILHLLEKEGIKLEKKNILVRKSIKETGVHTIHLKLKEDVPATFVLKIEAENPPEKLAVVEEVVQQEVKAQEELEEQEEDSGE